MHECGCKENILSGDNLFILQSPRNAMTAILALEYPGTDLLVHYTQILSIVLSKSIWYRRSTDILSRDHSTSISKTARE